MRNPFLRFRRLLMPAIAVTALLVMGPGAGQAADPFVAGGRSTRPVEAPAGHLARAEARGKALIAALGIPAVSHRATRLDDRFEHRIYDEVSSFDAHGKEVAISRFELDGRVAMAVGLGWRPGSGRSVDWPGAARRAAVLARAAGLAVDGQPDVRASAGAGGWSISWARLVDGVAVRGDGLRISLWPDGSFHGLARSERSLAARPVSSLDTGQVRAIAERFATERFGGPAATRIVAIEPAWVAPNDTFAAEQPDAPAATLRLAWIARFETKGALAERVRQIEVWIDAGDGMVLGGDVAE
jgi:hypothetical protein